MENKPSLSQYFGSTEVPPASQFFDEIGTSSPDMIQSVYLGENEPDITTTANLFPQNMTASYTQQQNLQETTFTNVLPTVTGSTVVSAASLPDPSTFFDNIGPEPQIGPIKTTMPVTNLLPDAFEGLNIKNQPVDKEMDRRRDAWIPNEEAKKTLMKAQSSPKGSFFPERDVLTMPGLVLDEELPDSLHEVAVRYLGVGGAGRAGVSRAEHVSRDDAGVRELMRTGCLRAAVNLTHTLLASSQGAGRGRRLTKHTPRTLQLWLTRFALLLRIRRTDILTAEAEPFEQFEKPDMYYQFYPETYEDRPGSMVPFALRLLVAELPSHAGKPELAVDRLYAVLAVIRQMLSNLRSGLTEDGSGPLPSEQDRLESLRLWTGRETRTLHSIVNCSIALKDYRQAGHILRGLLASASSVQQRRALTSALCRLWLLAGLIPAARTYCQAATELRLQICPTPDVREYVDLALLDIALGKQQDAYSNLCRAHDQEPTNIMVANNLSVCLLYMGRLNEAIAVLQKAINADPERGLNESLLVNLCTLYELESSKTQEKKVNLLRMLCKYKSDTFSNVLECLKLA